LAEKLMFNTAPVWDGRKKPGNRLQFWTNLPPELKNSSGEPDDPIGLKVKSQEEAIQPKTASCGT
jgi:hypothetical protein